jgi:hypothetical protein
MENINKSEVSAALKKALAEEHLWSRDAAKLLNMNPIYISFMLNPKSFDKCGSTAWARAYEWFLTKEPLASFKFPSEEAVWQAKKQEPNIEGSGMETIPALKKEKKEKKAKKEKPLKAKKEEEEKQPKPEKSHQPEKLNPGILGTLDKVISEKVEQGIFRLEL